MIRFHLDESADGRIARALRRRGIDVTTPAEVGLLGMHDEQHLAFARSENRVIVTQDADFLELHHSGALHSGIAYYPPGERSVGQVVGLLCLMHDCLQPEELMGQLHHI